ncbi:hypothetical protein HETIRDRAFT_438587 [Heterobasidion irregulare TC 32-1]|uniref:Late embryogenesis abundant protein LEA-2 subgroup domain-containing protein n=1 Tax=Heterobasidion irregulare (strain TC 32-1) TaxID=747525 RepID=W4KLX6_HETIT|nr:uncharacterized protein HETIRDRAFT_438587 [Heterobasidion irregulare TC 32-1]ETW86066.1 hypothetical protein HETIRDRAFT_438587 [Heterobasidion irregulare TC 32-1]
MATYRDPYAGQASQHQQQYQDGPEYNLYNTHQPHGTYDNGGYDDGYRDEPAIISANQSQERLDRNKEGNGFEEDYGTPIPRARTSRNLRAWRYENRGQMWTKGGRGRCIGRFCCCTLLVAVFLIISIILSLALWIRPPSVNIGDVQAPSNGSTLQELDNGLQLNLNVIIGVENPNYFAVDFKSIKAEIFFPINDTLIGSGQANNVNFPSHSNTNFTFPFDIKYTTDIDPSQQIISTIATKCLSNPQQQLTVSYKITLGLRILLVTIHPTISNNLSFDCPISADEIQSVLKNMGISGLSSILGGST